MILNITYPTYQTKTEIEKAVGSSFSIWERFRMGGIGSRKMIISEASESISNLLKVNTDTKYCNIEIRRSGLIIGFQSTLRIYAWLIPFYQLHMFHNGSQLNIYSLQDHIKLKPAFNGDIDKKFILKILENKTNFLQKQDFR